eukprot:2416336-Amphidinium_carterae.1
MHPSQCQSASNQTKKNTKLHQAGGVLIRDWKSQRFRVSMQHERKQKNRFVKYARAVCIIV